jgi:large subunit ribosomal protein L22
METTAKTRFVRLSPLKARGLARRIQGLPVAEALRLTGLTAGKGALLLDKTLKSAVANAKNTANLAEGDLRVKEAVVDEGPRLKRHWPRARGGASPILRRMSHIRITVTDEAAGAKPAQA